MAETKKLSNLEVGNILNLRESHFLDFKGKEIKPANITKTISAFSNASGGEIFVGIEEVDNLESTNTNWDGFVTEEDANGLLQTISALDPLGN